MPSRNISRHLIIITEWASKINHMKQSYIYLLSAMMTISAAPAESPCKMAPTAVKAPAVAKAQATPAVYYNLQGIRVDNPKNGIYIRRQGYQTSKVQL